ncbi:MAG: hypothetical protein KF878_00320 [Planctomycetes bacterium]|nr:hypothetical protein [Planctomycetota bacterium]
MAKSETGKKVSFFFETPAEQEAFEAVLDLFPGANATFLHRVAMRQGLLLIAADTTRAKIGPLTPQDVEQAKKSPGRKRSS